MAQEIGSVYVCEADLKENELRGVKVEGQWILIANHGGNYYGLDASCAHTGYPLFKGNLSSEGVITCPLHYAQFDCVSGKVVSDPRICEDQTIFSIKVECGKVYWLKT